MKPTAQPKADVLGAVLTNSLQSSAQVLLEARLKIDAAVTLIRTELERGQLGSKVFALANADQFAQTALLWIDKARKS